jgi:hypothetical protein
MPKYPPGGRHNKLADKEEVAAIAISFLYEVYVQRRETKEIQEQSSMQEIDEKER